MGGVVNTWGVSFYVGLLPYVEQAAIFQDWPFGSTDGYANGNTGLRGGANISSAGGPSVDVTNIRIPQFRCPSSPLPEFNGDLATLVSRLGRWPAGKSEADVAGAGASAEQTRRAPAAELHGASFSSSQAAIAPLVKDALQMMDGLPTRFPGDVQVLDLAAKLRQRLGDTPRAVSIWEQCLAREPHFAEASVSIGKIRFEAGDFSGAEAVLRPAVARAPDNAEASFVLASSLFNQGKFAETVQVLETSRAATPATVANEVLLGQAYLRLRQHGRAKACFLIATQRAPEYPNAYFGLAAACEGLGQAAEAAPHRQKFRELQAAQLRQSIAQTGRYDDLNSTRQDIANFYLAAGRLYLERGDEAAAEQHAKRALELTPDNEQGRAEMLSYMPRPAGCRRPWTCCCC